MVEWVFVDTCMWASFFAKATSPEKVAIDELLDADRVAVIGPIVAEVLVGFKRDDQAAWVASKLRLTHYVEASWNDWRSAADLSRALAAKGHKLPLTDLVVAVVALRCNASVYTSDPHFDVVENLKRYRPG